MSHQRSGQKKLTAKHRPPRKNHKFFGWLGEFSTPIDPTFFWLALPPSNLSLPLLSSSHRPRHRRIPPSDHTIKMADEVYDGAIGIDLGKSPARCAVRCEQDWPPAEAYSNGPTVSRPPFCRRLTASSRCRVLHTASRDCQVLTLRPQVPPTRALPRTRVPMSRSSPTSRVLSPPRRSSPSLIRSV